MSKIEDVARALAKEAGVLDGFRQDHNGATVVVEAWKRYIPAAAAAIAAMREPTEGMERAFWKAQNTLEMDPKGGWKTKPKVMLNFMIDAALEGKG